MKTIIVSLLLIILAIGVGGFIAIDIWSIVDATRVAKVNNLAWRDQNPSGFKHEAKILKPSPAPLACFSLGR